MNKTPIPNKHILTATLVIILFTLLTLADAPAPPPNVFALFHHENKVYAASGYYLYNSSDGGMTWESDDGNVFDYFDEQNESTQQIDIPDTQLAYRIAENGDIEKSTDNGDRWNLLVEYDPIPVIDIYYYSVMKPDAERILISPGDMIYEPVSGNVIIANGHAGIGVITSSGEYIPVQVDDYAPVDKRTYYDMQVFSRLLGHYLFSAFFLMLILINLWMIFSGEWVSNFLLILSIIAWIFMVETSFNTNYNDISFTFIAMFLFVLLIFLAIAHIQYFNKTIKAHPKISLLFSFIGNLIFVTPYLLWYFGLIAFYPASWISYSATLLWAVFILIKYHFIIKQDSTAVRKEYKFTFFWKPYGFRIYHLPDKVKNEDKQ